MEEAAVVNKGEEPLDLAPGFRFHPTDEEIVSYYLTEKVMNSSFSATAIGEADLNKCEPWDLPKKAKMGEKDWYFFWQRDRKYPTGMRTNRATQSGYWKATGKDREIFKGKGNLVGMKKTLVFYRGRAPKGEKTNWVMHEFRLEGTVANYNLPNPAKDEWVVSRIFHKNTDVRKTPIPGLIRMNSLGDDLLDFSSLPSLIDPPYGHTNEHAGYGDDHFKGNNQPSSANPPSDGYYQSSFFINNNQHQLLIKPEGHRTYEIPTNNYASSQENYSNPLGNTLSKPQIRIQNPCSSLQKNLSSDCYMYQGRNSSMPSVAGMGCGSNDDQAMLRAFAAKKEHIPGPNKECKMEYFWSKQSNMVSVSRETGTSNDRNSDASSVVSKLDNGRNGALYESLEGPSAVDPSQIWNAYGMTTEE